MRCGSSLAVFPGWQPGSPEEWKLLGLASVSRPGDFLDSSGHEHDPRAPCEPAPAHADIEPWGAEVSIRVGG